VIHVILSRKRSRGLDLQEHNPIAKRTGQKHELGKLLATKRSRPVQRLIRMSKHLVPRTSIPVAQK
jgi:hypothetical protein